MSSNQSVTDTMTLASGIEEEPCFTTVILLSAFALIARIRDMNRYIPRGLFPRRQRTEFWEMTANLSDSEFDNTFRMNRNTFKDLCAILRPFVTRRFPTQANSSRERSGHICGRDIQTEVKVGLFLRVMAGASVLDVHLLFGISRSSAFRIFRKVVMVVVRELPWQAFPLESVNAGFRDMALAFSLSRPVMNPLPGCVATLDGLQVQIARPAREFNPLQYFSRKGCFTLPVQALVDAQYRFIACSVLAVGSTHDNVAFSLSSMYRYLHSRALPNGFWVAGDEAYTCTESIVVPFSKSLCTPVHDGFNFYHSSHRIHVEQAFGMLKKRWSILYRPLGFSVQLSTKVIPAAMKLHNFVVNMGAGIPKPPRSLAEIHIAEERLDLWLRWCQTGEDAHEDLPYEVEQLSGSAKRAEEKSQTRKKLLTTCRREHLRRPSSSQGL